MSNQNRTLGELVAKAPAARLGALVAGPSFGPTLGSLSAATPAPRRDDALGTGTAQLGDLMPSSGAS